VIAALRGSGTLKTMVKFPCRLRVDGHYGYHMVLWGLVWIYVVSKHSRRLHGRGSFLQESGVLPIMVSTKTVDEFFAGMAENLRRTGKEL
jgi:hypothetical protein